MLHRVKYKIRKGGDANYKLISTSERRIKRD